MITNEQRILGFTKRLRLAGQRYLQAKRQLDAEQNRLHEAIADAHELMSFKQISEASGIGYSNVRRIGPPVLQARKLERYRRAFDEAVQRGSTDPISSVAAELGVSQTVAAHYVRQAGRQP